MYGADPWVKKFVSVNQRYLTLSHTLQSKLYDLESDVKPSNNPLHCYKTIYAKDSLERTSWLWKLVFCRVFLYYWHPQETVQVILWVPVAYESRPPSNPQHFNLLMTLNLPELLLTQRSYQPYFIGRQKTQVVSSELLKIKLDILGRTRLPRPARLLPPQAVTWQLSPLVSSNIP